MIGQDRLINHFNNLTLDTLPHSLMIVGDNGSGRHTLCNELASRLQLSIVNLNDKINAEMIELVNNIKEPTLCIIPGEQISFNEESVLLKFIEEPLPNLFIAVLCNSTNQMLPTIKNRCSVYMLDKYTGDVLKYFYDNSENKSFHSAEQEKIALSVINTPGKMILWNNLQFDKMSILATQIFDLIPKANIANILNIPTKIDFEGNDKFPVEPFVSVLLNVAYTRVIDNKTNATQHFTLTKKLISDLSIPNINKQKLFEHFLYTLKEMCNEGI